MKHAICLAAILAATPALAEPYAFIHGGAAKGACPSNDCGIETGSEAGWMGGIGGGYAWQLTDRFSVGSEVGLSARGQKIHGLNINGHKNSADDMDGNTLIATSLMLNARPCWLLIDPVSVCGTIGAGGAHLSALDDAAMTFAWKVGGGLEVDLAQFTGEPLSLSLGLTRFEARPVDLAGAEAEFTTRELNARLTYRFEGYGG